MKLKGNLKHILGENIFYDELSKKVFINNKDILLTKSEVKIIETLIKKKRADGNISRVYKYIR